jgi:hypothetical protein
MKRLLRCLSREEVMKLVEGKTYRLKQALPLILSDRKYRGRAKPTKHWTYFDMSLKGHAVDGFMDEGTEVIFSHRTASRMYAVDHYFTVPSLNGAMISIRNWQHELEHIISGG